MRKLKMAGEVLAVAYLVVGAWYYHHINPVSPDSSIPEDMLVTHGVKGIVPFCKSLVWPYFLVTSSRAPSDASPERPLPSSP